MNKNGKGIQHWSLAPNKGKRFTKEELAWFPGRVEELRRRGYNKYHIAKKIAAQVGRSIDSLRYQLFHSMKLWPTRPKQLQIETVLEKEVGKMSKKNWKYRGSPTERRARTPLDKIVADRNRERARRILAPIVVNLDKGRHTVIQPKDFDRLNIDDVNYQRMVIRDLVGDLIYVLRNGGDVPAPIHVAERKDGSWWILDGQQRFWAHMEVGVPLKAIIHTVSDLNGEKELYRLLNTRVNPTAMNTVKSDTGPLAKLIRSWNEQPESPMHEKINFGSNGRLPWDASLLAKGIFSCLAAGEAFKHQGAIDRLLKRSNYEWERRPRECRERAEKYLTLVSEIWPGPPRMRYLNALALGRVCANKWSSGSVKLPSRQAIYNLRRINWETLSPGAATKFLPMVMHVIEARWK